jgi:hypothetical protein
MTCHASSREVEKPAIMALEAGPAFESFQIPAFRLAQTAIIAGGTASGPIGIRFE